MKSIKGGVTAAKGFLANGISCGIKKSGKPDLALIYSPYTCTAAGVFTKNSIKAAPLVVSKSHLTNGKAQAIIVNSGNANCFTGKFGMIYAKRTAEIVAKGLNIKANDVVVSSTGIIGKPLPFKKIKNATSALIRGLTPTGSAKAAKAILTTDRITKEMGVQISLGGKRITIGGIAKGSGMIHPNMATMLAFITTDTAITSPLLKKALKMAVAKTFHRITVDGCMSTNDMVVIMASAQAKNKLINRTGKTFNDFTEALTAVCLDLAKKIVRDAEGATKFLAITVEGAETEKQAERIAMQIATSNLVKTAAFGSNPNWGRVAAAVGSLGLKKITEETLKMSFSSFKKKDIQITVGLNIGKGKATVYTSDLSYEYVRINGEYN